MNGSGNHKEDQVAKAKKRDWLGLARWVSQVGFVGYVLAAAILHATSAVETASLHTLCPFGAVETLGTLLTTGKYVSKIHPSAMVLGVGVLVGALVVGGAFCGWICPWGTVSDALSWVRRKLRWPELRVPEKLDRVLRYGRYLVLISIVYATMSTAKLWFAAYDPYHTLFSLGWIFEFNLATQWPAYAITLALLVGSVFVPRLWCRYLCPLGGLLSLVQRLSPFKVRRHAPTCINCRRCDRACPVKLDVSHGGAVSHDCVMCLRCVSECPAPGALEVALPGYESAPQRKEAQG
jgi:Pyruvate/2-oxoacid:ferredoxin oxidoreductase delta subunit